MNAPDQYIEIVGVAAFLIVGVLATLHACGFTGGQIVGSLHWWPEFKRQLRWLGPLLRLTRLGSLVFLFK